MKHLLTFNSTLGVHTFNITPGITCAGATTYCASHCYAKNGNFTLPSVCAALDARLMATQDLDTFIAAMSAEIHTRHISHVRIHSAGDFYSHDYFRAWLTIAEFCPDTVFFAYTRMWRVDGWPEVLPESELVPNLALWYSTDPVSGMPPNGRVSYILDPDHGTYHPSMPCPNCRKQTDHATCATCGLCFDKSRNAVTFNLH